MRGMVNMDQKQATIQHIELYIRKHETTVIPEVKRDYMHKIMGMLSLARMLDIISSDEYEQYFERLFL